MKYLVLAMGVLISGCSQLGGVHYSVLKEQDRAGFNSNSDAELLVALNRREIPGDLALIMAIEERNRKYPELSNYVDIIGEKRIHPSRLKPQPSEARTVVITGPK